MRLMILACVVCYVNGQFFTPFPVKTCVPKSRCSCENVDGVIDLHPLANNDGTPRFRDIPDHDGKTFFSWNPCYGFDEAGCSGVAIVKINDNGSSCTSLGNQSSLVFVASSQYNQEYMYTQWGGQNYSGHVIITCDASEEGVVTRRPDGDYENNFYLELKSKYACPVKTNDTTNGTTTVGPTVTRGRMPTTPAFIKPAITPQPTDGPVFDIDTLGAIMIVILVVLLMVLLTLFGLFLYVATRGFRDVDKTEDKTVNYGSVSDNQKKPLTNRV